MSNKYTSWDFIIYILALKMFTLYIVMASHSIFGQGHRKLSITGGWGTMTYLYGELHFYGEIVKTIGGHVPLLFRCLCWITSTRLYYLILIALQLATSLLSINVHTLCELKLNVSYLNTTLENVLMS